MTWLLGRQHDPWRFHANNRFLMMRISRFVCPIGKITVRSRLRRLRYRSQSSKRPIVCMQVTVFNWRVHDEGVAVMYDDKDSTKTPKLRNESRHESRRRPAERDVADTQSRAKKIACTTFTWNRKDVRLIPTGSEPARPKRRNSSHTGDENPGGHTMIHYGRLRYMMKSRSFPDGQTFLNQAQDKSSNTDLLSVVEIEDAVAIFRKVQRSIL